MGKQGVPEDVEGTVRIFSPYFVFNGSSSQRPCCSLLNPSNYIAYFVVLGENF